MVPAPAGGRGWPGERARCCTVDPNRVNGLCSVLPFLRLASWAFEKLESLSFLGCCGFVQRPYSEASGAARAQQSVRDLEELLGRCERTVWGVLGYSDVFTSVFQVQWL